MTCRRYRLVIVRIFSVIIRLAEVAAAPQTDFAFQRDLVVFPFVTCCAVHNQSPLFTDAAHSACAQPSNQFPHAH